MASRIEIAAREYVTARGPLLEPEGAFALYDALVQAIEEHDKNAPLNDAYRLAAQETKQRDGELEIDHDAVVSLSDDGGAYVAAWVWVDDDEAGVEWEDETAIDEHTQR